MLDNSTTHSSSDLYKNRETNEWKWHDDPSTIRQPHAGGWTPAASIGKDTAPKPFPTYDPQPPIYCR